MRWAIKICVVSALTLLTVGCHVSREAVVVSDPVVYIDGEVGNPGRYRWTEGMTIHDILGLSGGLTEFANRRRILIVRFDAVHTVDMDRDTFPLQESDVIHVKRRLF